MRRPLHILVLAGLAAVALAATAPARAAPIVAGLWTLGEGKTEIAIDECGETLCGRIVNAAKIEANPNVVDKKNKNPLLRLRKLKGLLVLAGFTGGPSEWRGGTIYNPSDGGTYKATLKLEDPNTIRVTGCIVRPLCKSAKLTRVHAEENAAIGSSDRFALARR